MEQTTTKKLFAAKVSSVETVAQGVKKFTFTIDGPFVFSIGQYVWVEIPKLEINDLKGSRRAFSICSIPNKENTISIVGRISESGYKQSLFALAVNDGVVIHGPFGSSFVLDEHSPKNIMMLAGGVSIAVILPTLEAIKKQSLPITCFLVYLNNNEAGTPFLSELELIKNSCSFFDYTVKYERFIWSDIKDVYATSKGETRWWIVGCQAMVNHVYQILEDGGVPRIDMVLENFYPDYVQNLNLEKIKEQFQKDSLLMQAIQNSTNHTIIADANGIILFANKAAEKITGYTQEEILGNTPRLWGGMMSSDFYKDLWTKAVSGESFVGEIINRRKNGEIYHSIAHISPIFGDGKRVIGFIGNEEDITDLQEEKEKIRNLNERFKLATESANIGVWEWDVARDSLIVNREFYMLYNATEEDSKNARDWWLKRLHPEDRDSSEAALQDALENKKQLDISSRVVWDDGSVHALRIVANIERSSDGKPIKLVGIQWDVTKEAMIDKEKTEFVSLASHQLKTPVGAIQWNLEMLLAGDYGKVSSEQEDVLRSTYTMGVRINELINSLLNISRIEMGVFIIEPVPTDFVQLCEGVLTEMESRRVEKGHKIIKTFDEKLPNIPADPKLLRIVFQNFISNAIKYTQNKGKINVSLKVDGEDVVFSVANNGEPIPEADQAKIFQKMFRASNAREQDSDGNGLGLYMVKQIMENAGGRVWFTSGAGEDTVFYASLPLTGMIRKEGAKQLS